MPTGTGLDGSVGVGAESTVGTYAAPSRWFLWKSDSLSRVKTTVQGSSFGGGQYDLAARRVVTTRMAKGSLTLDLVDRGFGLLFDQALGSTTVTARGGVTGVTDIVATPAPLRGKTMTVQIGRPSSAGAVEPFSYVGCKVGDIDLTIAKNGIAEMSLALVAIDEQTLGTTGSVSPALVTPAPSLLGVPFSFLSAALTLGGSAIAGVEKINIKHTHPMQEDRFFLNGGGLPAEMLGNAMRKIEGSLDAEFTSRTALYDAYTADTALALVLTLTGAPIGSTGVNAALKVEIPVVKLNGGTPPLAGGGPLKMTVPYEGFGDGVNPAIKYTYTTSDSAL